MPELREEIKQTKPWRSLHEEAHLNIARTWAVIGHEFAEAIKPYGVTGTQYNVLRILRGAGEHGLCRQEVRERLVAQVPDVTRLLDRMEESGLIARERGEEDRRFVTTRITNEGLQLLAELEEPVQHVLESQLGHMSPDDLRKMIALLSVARQRG